MAETTVPAAEFQALPLEFVVAAPLTAAIKAQAIAAQATRSFLEGMIDQKTKKPIPVRFGVEVEDEKGKKKATVIDAPLLALVPVPHLRIDSLDIEFQYEITQTYRDTRETSKSADISASTGGLLSPWVKASISGSISNKTSVESTTNRSGSLSISVKASEAAIPEGLARILTLLANSIPSVGGEENKPG
jgi:outer membrane usher protein FimD/PapC